jgi:hypothetical protein
MLLQYMLNCYYHELWRAHLVLAVPRVNLVKGTLKPGLSHIRRLIEPEGKRHLPLSSTL